MPREHPSWRYPLHEPKVLARFFRRLRRSSGDPRRDFARKRQPSPSLRRNWMLLASDMANVPIQRRGESQEQQFQSRTARAYLGAGLCPLPAIVAEKRPDLSGWKQYQKRTANGAGRSNAGSPTAQSICLLTGAVCGNLELIDFDQRANYSFPGRTWSSARSPGTHRAPAHRAIPVRRQTCRLPMSRSSARQPQTGPAHPCRAQRRADRDRGQARTYRDSWTVGTRSPSR